MINIKKTLLIVFLAGCAIASNAQWQYDTTVDGNKAAVMAAREQDRQQQTKLQQSPWFFGGGLVLGFSSGAGAVGVSPVAGYKVNDYIDAGMGLNLVYHYNNYYYRNRAFNVGLMPFVRAFPINNLFTQLQFEQAWVNGNYLSNDTKVKYNYDYQALIASLGYANRVNGRVGFFVSVGIDLLKDPNSPYRYSNGRIMPVFSTGVNF